MTTYTWVGRGPTPAMHAWRAPSAHAPTRQRHFCYACMYARVKLSKPGLHRVAYSSGKHSKIQIAASTSENFSTLTGANACRCNCSLRIAPPAAMLMLWHRGCCVAFKGCLSWTFCRCILVSTGSGALRTWPVYVLFEWQPDRT